MDNNPVENTKNTPSAAASSHRERGNLSAFSFFPDGDSAFFSSSLSTAQLPASTTTLRGAAMTITAKPTPIQSDYDSQAAVFAAMKTKGFQFSTLITNTEQKIGVYVWIIAAAATAAAVELKKRWRWGALNPHQNQGRISDRAERNSREWGSGNMLRDWKRAKKFQNFELKNGDEIDGGS